MVTGKMNTMKTAQSRHILAAARSKLSVSCLAFAQKDITQMLEICSKYPCISQGASLGLIGRLNRALERE